MHGKMTGTGSAAAGGTEAKMTVWEGERIPEAEHICSAGVLHFLGCKKVGAPGRAKTTVEQVPVRR